MKYESGRGSRAELYLESAILAEPRGPHAAAAYRLLETRVRASWSDDAGRLPEAIETHLQGLRRYAGLN